MMYLATDYVISREKLSLAMDLPLLLACWNGVKEYRDEVSPG